MSEFPSSIGVSGGAVSGFIEGAWVFRFVEGIVDIGWIAGKNSIFEKK
jgi:hypothetical protein